MFIGTKNLSHTYMPGSPFATEALRDISFSLGKGCFTLLIGPSGSGKSTLIQHLNGLLKPTSGQVYFEDKAIGADKHELLLLRRRIGLVFQMPEDQFFSETVFDEVAFAPRNLGLPEGDVRNRVVEALEKVGLDAEEYMDHHPFQLSAGQKRLVAVAAVLSLQPEVLVLDEPTAGLDAAGQNNLFRLLEKLNHESGLTVIISTHHLDEAAALADTVLVLHNGKLVMSGSRNEVFSKREELFDLGLELPALSELMNELAKEGLPVKTAVYTLDDARNEINKVFRWHSK
ncbi:MAG: energy-coupling factor transporter ATPase [Bacillota bacterium]|nr:energy-coupling factor transporter ATPase [Bacillota bacterium]